AAFTDPAALALPPAVAPVRAFWLPARDAFVALPRAAAALRPAGARAPAPCWRTLRFATLGDAAARGALASSGAFRNVSAFFDDVRGISTPERTPLRERCDRRTARRVRALAVRLGRPPRGALFARHTVRPRARCYRPSRPRLRRPLG